MGCIGEVGRLVRDMTRERMGLVSAGEGLVEGSGLDDSLMGELFVGGSHDAESWGGFPFRGGWRLGAKAAAGVAFFGTLHGGIAGLGGLL
jgi:hypothetical protein